MCKYCENQFDGKKATITCFKSDSDGPFKKGFASDKLFFTASELESFRGIFRKDFDQFKFCNTSCGCACGEVKPLTVEQLKQMDGKPVYVVPIGSGGGEKQWCIMFFDIRGGDGHNGACIAGDDMFFYPLYSYSKDWLAFDREPKGEAE